jgi:hypothetical protein
MVYHMVSTSYLYMKSHVNMQIRTAGQGWIAGAGGGEAGDGAPTIAVVAHYDTFAVRGRGGRRRMGR